MYAFATLAIFVTAAVAAPAPAHFNKLKRSTTGLAKENSYIVKLKDNASRQASISSLEDLVFAFDDTESYKEIGYSDWEVLNGYSAILTGKALEHVLADPNVEYVEEDGILSIDWDSSIPLEAREPLPAPEPELTGGLVKRAEGGAGVIIYGIDTGIRTTHTSFTGRASWGAAFGGYAQSDGNGHGTHTAGTFGGVNYGYATSATLIAVKVLSDSGSGTTADVISGVNFARTNCAGRACVANMSLGGGASTSLDSAVGSAISAGVHFTLAAGNSNVDASTTSPARVAAAITVGAVSSNNCKASFSNFGAVVDVWALGVSVLSAYYTSNTATATLSGTSMAAPRVAGILAVVIGRYGNQTPAALSADLKAHASAVGCSIPSGTTNLVISAPW